MHFGCNNQFIKVKRILDKISKTKKKLFCLSVSIWGTTLHVMFILDIQLFFQIIEQLDFIALRWEPPSEEGLVLNLKQANN